MPDYNFRVRATDNTGAYADQDFSMTVANTGAETMVAIDATNAYTSRDGSTWITRAGIGSAVLGSPTPTSIAYGNGLWIVLSTGNTYYTSTDGVRWVPRTLSAGFSTTPTRIWFVRDRFLVMGTPSGSASVGAFAQSLDGITWTIVGNTNGALNPASNQTVTFGGSGRGVLFINWMNATSAQIGYSTSDPDVDLTSLTTTTMPGASTNSSTTGAIYIGGVWYIVDSPGARIIYSADQLASCFVRTVTKTVPSGVSLDRIYYGNGRLLITTRKFAAAAATLNTVYVSDDLGQSWTARTFPALYSVASGGTAQVHMICAFINGGFLIGATEATGNANGMPLRASKDGVTWTSLAPTGFPAAIRGLATVV